MLEGAGVVEVGVGDAGGGVVFAVAGLVGLLTY